MTQRSERLSLLPPYLFAEIDRRKNEAIAAKRDVIDFGVGDPDQPTPTFIVDRMTEAIRDPVNHVYSFGIGTLAFREAAARYFSRRFGVTLDPKTEIIGLLGSKEGIGHLPIGVLNPGDVVLVPEPGYPVYVSGTIFAGGRCHAMPLTEERGWLPDLSAVPADVARRAKILWLNYPNNPTGAVAPRSFYEDVVAFARDHGILIAQDAPYCDLYFGEDRPLSLLQIPGANDVAIEFHSLSKTFNMTGWRIAFAVGQRDALAALAKVKSNLDSGIFQAVQVAAMAALDGYDQPEIRDLREMYRKRCRRLVAGLREAGWPASLPQATIYVWAKLPKGVDSQSAARRLLDEANVVVIPGAGLGATGEGFVRFSVVRSEERIAEAVRRISSIRW